MISRAPAKASSRWAAETATITLDSPSGTRADAVLGGGGLEPVALERLGDDRGDPLLRHLAVGLVLEPLDVAGRALEGHDRAGRRRARRVAASRSTDSGSSVTRT